MIDCRLNAAVSFYLEPTPRAVGGFCKIPVAWNPSNTDVQWSAVGAWRQEHGRTGIPSLTSHYLYLISSVRFDIQSVDGHSVSRRSAARNRKHKQIKPKIKIGLFRI